MTSAYAKLKEETVRIEFDRNDFQVLDIALAQYNLLRSLYKRI